MSITPCADRCTSRPLRATAVTAPAMSPAAILMWIAIAALGAAGFGVIALSRGETISAAWILVAGVCTYLVAYRFYARFIASRIFALDPQRATPAERLNNGRDFRPDEPVDRLRPSLRRDLRRRPADRPDAGGPVRLSARHHLADRRRRARRRRAGFHDSHLVDPARRQVARPDGEGRSEPGRRPGGHGRDPRDHDHPARRPRAGRRQRAARQPVGAVHDRDHDSDRAADGLVDEESSGPARWSRRR